jgi:hypothetical protein
MSGKVGFSEFVPSQFRSNARRSGLTRHRRHQLGIADGLALADPDALWLGELSGLGVPEDGAEVGVGLDPEGVGAGVVGTAVVVGAVGDELPEDAVAVGVGEADDPGFGGDDRDGGSTGVDHIGVGAGPDRVGSTEAGGAGAGSAPAGARGGCVAIRYSSWSSKRAPTRG